MRVKPFKYWEPNLSYSYHVEIKNTLSSLRYRESVNEEVYAAGVAVRKRNTIIIGLLLYQGIRTSELKRIRTKQYNYIKEK